MKANIPPINQAPVIVGKNIKLNFTLNHVKFKLSKNTCKRSGRFIEYDVNNAIKLLVTPTKIPINTAKITLFTYLIKINKIGINAR